MKKLNVFLFIAIIILLVLLSFMTITLYKDYKCSEECFNNAVAAVNEIEKNNIENKVSNIMITVTNTLDDVKDNTNIDKYTNKVVSTKPYIPEGMEVADPNDNSGIKASDVKIDYDIEKVKIEVLEDSVTNKGLEILITDNNENSYGWGEAFELEQNVDNMWKKVEYISDDLAWIEIAYLVDENNELRQKLNVEKYYGQLESGIYRVVKTIWINNEYVSIYSNEFEIK